MKYSGRGKETKNKQTKKKVDICRNFIMYNLSKVTFRHIQWQVAVKNKNLQSKKKKRERKKKKKKDKRTKSVRKYSMVVIFNCWYDWTIME